VAHIQVLIGSGDFKRARTRLMSLEQVVRLSDDVATHTMLLGNLGYCARELGLNEEAMRCYEEAAILYEELGNRSESTRVRWNVATLLAAEGRIHQALSRFEAVRDEMNALGMTGAAAVIALEIAELRLTLGDFNAVEELCRAAIASFSTSGMAHTAKALTALGLMSEAVRSRTATPHLVRKVRDYVRRLPEEPQLLFAPLPEP
jgi:tetratricopeptide (TPR) repeat protein